jgi:hypothetical protein
MARFVKRHLITTAAAALVLLGAVGIAVAHTGNGEETTTDEQEAALEEVCGEKPRFCTLWSSFADPAAGGSNEKLVQVGDAVARWGKPASACPEAAAAFEAAGYPVDGFIGPCPDPAEAPSRSDAKTMQERFDEVRQTLEESR